MTNTVNNLDPETAPRTVAGLAQFSGYQLQKLAEKLGMTATPETEAAILRTGKQERAEKVARGLEAWDKAHGHAVPATPTSPVAQPARVAPSNGAPPAPGAVIKQPVAPGGAPAPAVSGRKRSPVTATPAAAPAAALAAAPAPVPTGNFPVTTVDLTPALSELNTIKASVAGLSKTVLDLQQQNERLRGKLDAIMFMISQIGEQTVGVPAQEFLNDAVGFVAKQGKE